MSFCSTGYELDILPSYLKTLISHSLTSLLLSFNSVFCHFDSLPECFLEWPLFVVTWYSWFWHFYHFNSSPECFLEWLIVLIAYLSAFLNNPLLLLLDILGFNIFIISIAHLSAFLNNSLFFNSLFKCFLKQHLCCFDILEWLVIMIFLVDISLLFW